ncbi:MAG: T9SS type A sorting domain-containing protein, partial [Bacteroidota bacterium]
TPNKAIAFWADGRENNGRLRLYTNQSVLRPAIATGLIDPIQTELRLYPNPARELIYLDMSVPQFGQATVQLIHPSGQVFLPALSTQNGLLAISVRDLPKGLYILQWQTDQEVLRRKVLISHDTF